VEEKLMALSGGSDDGSPMIDMNMTPLIDVLLAVLILLMFTVPMATHSVDIDLPSPSAPTDQIIDPVKNKIVLTEGGEILWNGHPIDQGQLLCNLKQTLTFAVEPELQFEPEPNAAYDLSAKTLNIIKGSGVTKFGFVGNEKYRIFGKGHGV
jgi:biopolymer transport protein ExbD